jgi:hypothetical protein
MGARDITERCRGRRHFLIGHDLLPLAHFAIGIRESGSVPEFIVVTRFHKLLLGLVFLACPLSSGCFIPVGYAYPTVGMTPPLHATATTESVRAFRVDVHKEFGYMKPGGESTYSLKEILISDDGWISSQAQFGFGYAWYLNCIAFTYDHEIHETLRVRIYRPGYETIQVKPWAIPKELVWTSAADLNAQETAVDALVAPGPILSSTDHSLFAQKTLVNGSSSKAQRDALLFAASEYERLADLAAAGTEGEALRDRLRGKANGLIELAGK